MPELGTMSTNIFVVTMTMSACSINPVLVLFTKERICFTSATINFLGGFVMFSLEGCEGVNEFETWELESLGF